MTKYVKRYLEKRIQQLAEDEYTRGELTRKEKDVKFFQGELDRYHAELEQNADLRDELLAIWRALPNDESA